MYNRKLLSTSQLCDHTAVVPPLELFHRSRNAVPSGTVASRVRALLDLANGSCPLPGNISTPRARNLTTDTEIKLSISDRIDMLASQGVDTGRQRRLPPQSLLGLDKILESSAQDTLSLGSASGVPGIGRRIVPLGPTARAQSEVAPPRGAPLTAKQNAQIEKTTVQRRDIKETDIALQFNAVQKHHREQTSTNHSRTQHGSSSTTSEIRRSSVREIYRQYCIDRPRDLVSSSETEPLESNQGCSIQSRVARHRQEDKISKISSSVYEKQARIQSPSSSKHTIPASPISNIARRPTPDHLFRNVHLACCNPLARHSILLPVDRTFSENSSLQLPRDGAGMTRQKKCEYQGSAIDCHQHNIKICSTFVWRPSCYQASASGRIETVFTEKSFAARDKGNSAEAHGHCIEHNNVPSATAHFRKFQSLNQQKRTTTLASSLVDCLPQHIPTSPVPEEIKCSKLLHSHFTSKQHGIPCQIQIGDHISQPLTPREEQSHTHFEGCYCDPLQPVPECIRISLEQANKRMEQARTETLGFSGGSRNESIRQELFGSVNGDPLQDDERIAVGRSIPIQGLCRPENSASEDEIVQDAEQQRKGSYGKSESDQQGDQSLLYTYSRVKATPMVSKIPVRTRRFASAKEAVDQVSIRASQEYTKKKAASIRRGMSAMKSQSALRTSSRPFPAVSQATKDDAKSDINQSSRYKPNNISLYSVNAPSSPHASCLPRKELPLGRATPTRNLRLSMPDSHWTSNRVAELSRLDHEKRNRT